MFDTFHLCFTYVCLPLINAKPTTIFIELAKEIRPFRFKLDANADFVNSCASLNRSLQCPSRFRSLCSISRWNLLSWPWWRLICSCGWTAKKPVPVAGGIIRSRWLWIVMKKNKKWPFSSSSSSSPGPLRFPLKWPFLNGDKIFNNLWQQSNQQQQQQPDH